MRSFVIAVLVAIVVATGFAAALNLFQKTADTEWVYACSDCSATSFAVGGLEAMPWKSIVLPIMGVLVAISLDASG
jgi:hypothetical protein